MRLQIISPSLGNLCTSATRGSAVNHQEPHCYADIPAQVGKFCFFGPCVYLRQNVYPHSQALRPLVTMISEGICKTFHPRQRCRTDPRSFAELERAAVC